MGDGQAWAPLACLAITPAFAAANGWQFPDRSVAILNLTGGSALWAWERTLRAAGLRNVLGWTAPVSATRMVAFADDLMPLLLATNRIGRNVARYGVTWPPRLRTHGIGPTAFFLSTRGGDLDTPRLPLDYLPESVAPLIVQTLLPTIDHVLIREGSREAEFIGLFGAQRDSVADPVQRDGRSGVVFGTSYGEVGEGLLVSDEARALVADAADPPVKDTIGVDGILDWSKGNVITVDISSAGPRGGYLQVRNGGRISNAVPITYWRIPVVATAEIEGGLQVRCNITLHLRADVSGHRLEPVDKPHEVRTTIPLESMFECDAVYQASGEISQTVDRVATTITWSGGSRNANATPGFHDIGCSGILDMLARSLPISLTAVDGVHDQRTVKKRGNELLLDETTQRPAVLTVGDLPQAPLAFEFDERWTLLADQHRSPGEPVDMLGRRALTYSVSWGQVTPEFPPADDFGGT